MQLVFLTIRQARFKCTQHGTKITCTIALMSFVRKKEQIFLKSVYFVTVVKNMFWEPTFYTTYTQQVVYKDCFRGKYLSIFKLVFKCDYKYYKKRFVSCSWKCSLDLCLNHMDRIKKYFSSFLMISSDGTLQSSHAVWW